MLFLHQFLNFGTVHEAISSIANATLFAVVSCPAKIITKMQPSISSVLKLFLPVWALLSIFVTKELNESST